MTVNAQPVELLLKNTVERVDIQVTDANGVPIDATALHLRVYDFGENLKVEDDFFTGLVFPTPPAPGPTRIVRAGTGDYYYPFGQYANETTLTGKFYFNWTVTGASGSEPVNIVQVVRIVSLRTLGRLPDFRNYVDKSSKIIDDDPLEPCYLGYTDSMLIGYMEGGLGLINAYQPYPTFPTIDHFPELHLILLYDASLLVALNSQELFAIDTDIPNWNDQGNSFVLLHQPPIAAMAQRIAQRLDRMVPDMKKQYVQTGSLRLEMGPNFRLAQLLAAAPSGSLFRSLFFAP